MPFKRRSIIVLPVACLAVTVLLVAQMTASGQAMGAVKFEGAWIAKVTGMDGVAPGTALPFRWSYVVIPSPSGRSATIHGSVDVPFPPLIPYDFVTPIIGEARLIGPDALAVDSIWYAVRKDSPVNQIVLIGTSRSEGRFLSPGRIEATHHFALYLPDADIDGDGFPEGVPIVTFDVTTIDTRLPSGS